MRYARPLVSYLVVRHDVRAVILFVEFEVHARKIIDGERLALQVHFVRVVLELGEHGLTEQRRAEAVEPQAQQVLFDINVLDVFHKIFVEQCFVANGRDLGDEYAVIPLGIRLIFLRIVRMQAVPELVREREYVLGRRRVIEQDVRVRGIRRPAVCAAALAGGRHYVYPTLGHSAL